MKKVREGYKMTELGEIPSEWEIKSIGEIFDFSGGLSISRAKLTDKGVNYLHYGDIHMRNENYINTDKDEVWLPKIEDNFEEIKENVKLNSGDVVFADASEDYEGIGKSVAIFNDFEKPFVAGLHTIVAKDINNQLENNYKRYCFSTNEVRKQFRYLATGTSVYGISRENIKKIKINIPTIKEQEKIASILSTVDEQIDNVDALIEKNKELKKGLMQTLLTKGIGHTKFKKTEIGEIPEEWEVKNLSEVVWYQEGPGLRKWQFTSAGIKVINVTNLVGNYLDLSNTSRYIDESEVEKKYKHFLIDENDIVVASSGNSWGKVSVVRKRDLPLLMNTSVIRFKSMEEERLSTKYLLQFLKSDAFKKQIALLITGSAQPNFGPYHLDRTKIATPNINEQLKIASILSEADEKIKKYENKKQKLEELKKGLMQQLLTGKIRVI